MKDILKWGAIIVVAFLAWRWLSGMLSQGQGVVSAGTIYGGWSYAAPLVGPGPVTAWQSRWNRSAGARGGWYGRRGN